MDLVELAGDLGLDALLDDQDGVLRRDQALRAGLSRSRLDDLLRRGKWTRLLPNVYLAAATTPSARQRIRGGWLWAGPTGTVGGAAAAYWQGYQVTEPRSVDVLKLTGSRLTAPGYRVLRSTVHDRDRCWRDHIRVTTPARTCLDLARAGLEHLSEDALRQRFLTVSALERSLPHGFHRRGQVAARTVVTNLASGPWSRSETLAHGHLRAAGIAGWVANSRVVIDGEACYPDIAFEDVKLAVEIDGFETHGTRSAFASDRRRNNLLVGAGWTVLHFTWDDLLNPERFIATIVATLNRLRAAR